MITATPDLTALLILKRTHMILLLWMNRMNQEVVLRILEAYTPDTVMKLLRKIPEQPTGPYVENFVSQRHQRNFHISLHSLRMQRRCVDSAMCSNPY